MTDTVKIDLTLAELMREVKVPEPYTFVLSKNKRVNFKDPFSFKLSEKEEILGIYYAMRRGEADEMDFLKRIMTDDDVEAYIAEDLSMRHHAALVDHIMAHFQPPRGDAGKDNA